MAWRSLPQLRECARRQRRELVRITIAHERDDGTRAGAEDTLGVPLLYGGAGDPGKRLLRAGNRNAIGMSPERCLRREPHRIAKHVVANRHDIRERHRALRLEMIVRKARVLRHVGQQLHRRCGVSPRHRDRPTEAVPADRAVYAATEHLPLLGDLQRRSGDGALLRRPHHQRRQSAERLRFLARPAKHKYADVHEGRVRLWPDEDRHPCFRPVDAHARLFRLEPRPRRLAHRHGRLVRSPGRQWRASVARQQLEHVISAPCDRGSVIGAIDQHPGALRRQVAMRDVDHPRRVRLEKALEIPVPQAPIA